MQRVATQHLKKWIENEKRKPLVIRGARQVGKSTLVRQFAEENKLKLNERENLGTLVTGLTYLMPNFRSNQVSQIY